MKIRMTVTVEVEDPEVYELDDEGWPVTSTGQNISREEVALYVVDAVSSWGGQLAPGDPFFPTNIKSVRARGTGFSISSAKGD